MDLARPCAGSPPTLYQHTETSQGHLRRVPSFLCSDVKMTSHSVIAVNLMCLRCALATDSATICGRSAYISRCQSGTSSVCRSAGVDLSRPVHDGSVATGEQMSVWTAVDDSSA